MITNRELKAANSSGLGVKIGSVYLSLHCFADDANLLKNTMENTQALVNLSEHLSMEVCLTNALSKTKLLVINSNPLKKAPFPLIPQNIYLQIVGSAIHSSSESTDMGILIIASCPINRPY